MRGGTFIYMHEMMVKMMGGPRIWVDQHKESLGLRRRRSSSSSRLELWVLVFGFFFFGPLTFISHSIKRREEEERKRM